MVSIFRLPEILYPIEDSAADFNSYKFTSLTNEKLLSVPVSNARQSTRKKKNFNHRIMSGTGIFVNIKIFVFLNCIVTQQLTTYERIQKSGQ